MARDGDRLFSVIVPSTGKRPKALQKAVSSVDEAVEFAGLDKGQVEILIGFDGTKGKTPRATSLLRTFTLPKDNDWGNGVRDMLLKIASGEKIVFLDDDNALKPHAFKQYIKHFDAEMVIGRVDTQLVFERPFIPVFDAEPLVRQGNIHPLCLSLSRRLVVDRCGGWLYRGSSDADYRNILHWHRRAHSVTVIEDVVGIYDAGRSLDSNALSTRQKTLLDRLVAARVAEAPHGVAPVPLHCVRM
ncbi:glycosyltransferase [Pseudodesulfovibrio sp. JC047]|uniref:glycosyltransferase n=1 Tax=Pseudodesulfovibrio sp. JC047 TaxID=2683199 RepID=UPI0013D49679|nr:glycosyltransferase [Pseudodesulfovibrio sp. JC047]NDV20993.1 glycosyltransferase [Pseudodesulfovibrio sp. JC047]